MQPHLPLSSLRAFDAVTRTGSFSAAATHLGLTPSAVSHAIRALERAIGAALFAREGRQVRLTAEGETLMRHVERGFDELRQGIAAISTRAPRLLRLHCAPSFAAQWLVPRLRRLIVEADGLELRIAADTNYTSFVDDTFDADIVYGTPSAGAYAKQQVVVLPLGSETLAPLCAPEIAARIATPRSLLDEILIESDQKRLRWPDWFAANGLVPPAPRGPRFDRSFLSISAAADGIGVALESLRLSERELDSGRLVRPLEGHCHDLSYVAHWLVFPAARRHARPIAIFTDWLAQELGLSLDLAALEP